MSTFVVRDVTIKESAEDAGKALSGSTGSSCLHRDEATMSLSLTASQVNTSLMF